MLGHEAPNYSAEATSDNFTKRDKRKGYIVYYELSNGKGQKLLKWVIAVRTTPFTHNQD
jgi:hypothetical protein